MSEYGQVVGQGGQATGSGHAGSGSTDVGAAVGASLSDALNHTSAALGVPPALLVVVAIAVVLFVGWFVFAR
jgi:hypothetical protein